MTAPATNDDHVFYRNPTKYYPTALRGEGIYIYDVDGKKYIDGSGGAAVVNIGHNVKEVNQAMMEQASLISFTHGTQFTTKSTIDLAEAIIAMSPPNLERVYFCSTGSEAVETAVKMARQYQVDRGMPMKFKTISRWTSFHGNSLGSLTLGGHTGRRKYYQPLILHTPHIAPCYCYRCPLGLKPENCNCECADELEKTILYEGPDSVSAFIVEPIVGATAGCLVPKDGYFQKIRAICDKYDVLLIADEVMTGVGRTGKNFAMEHWKVDPHMIIAAKGLASGYSPINCVVVSGEIHRVIKEKNGAFVHGHTYSQNPLSSAAAKAVLDYIATHDLVERSARLGAYLLEKLQVLYRHRIVGDVRGLGLFAGIELVKDTVTKECFEPSQKVNVLVGGRAFQKGLITYPGEGGADGIRGDHILLAPPYVITEEEIDTLVAILDESIAEIQEEKNF